MESEEESPDQSLPRGIFRNRSSWFCYELYKFSRPVEILALLLILTWTKNAEASDFRDVVISVLCSPFFWFFIFVKTPLRLDYLKWNPKNLEKLAQQVLESNPGVDVKKWDIISCKLNTIFYEERIWDTRYFFYDGQHARRVFKRNILDPFSKGAIKITNETDEIRASMTYLESITEKFEFYLKNDLAEFTSECEPELQGRVFRNGFFYNIFLGGFGFLFDLFITLLLLSPSGLCTLYFIVGDPRRTIRRTSFWSFVRLVLVVFFIIPNLCSIWTMVYHRSFNALQFWLKDMFPDLALRLYIAFRMVLYSDPLMSAAEGIKFLALIVKHEPHKNLARWDEIARCMNECMKGYQFTDGKDCLGFYKKYFEPLLHGRGSLEYDDLRDIVARTQPYVG